MDSLPKPATLWTKDYKRFEFGNKSFEGAEFANKALPGDTVISALPGCNLVSRTQHPPLSGILDLTSKYVYGMTSRGHPLYLFRPLNPSYPTFIVGSAEKDRTRNLLALVRFERWEPSSKFPQGSIQEILGAVGDLEAEKLALVWRYSPWIYRPSKIPKEAAVAAAAAAAAAALEEDREVIDAEYIFNIDPPGCKDIDDVLSLDFNKKELGISIADVTASPLVALLDADAKRRATTLYLDGNAIRPMLPIEISEDKCSLKKGERRPAVTLFYNWDSCQVRWANTILTNKETYTYQKAQCELPAPVRRKLEELAGSNDSHDWIEWAMLKYNEEAGKRLLAVGNGILRRHDGSKINMEFLLSLYGLEDEDFQILSTNAAEYCLARSAKAQPAPHKKLGLETYAHASSPIRRYCDLINQRVLKGTMATEVDEETVKWLNWRQKEAKRFERDMFYLTAVSNREGSVEGIYIGDKSVYVKSWKQIIRLQNPLLPQTEAGQRLQIGWFVDWQESQWKRRVIFSQRLLSP